MCAALVRWARLVEPTAGGAWPGEEAPVAAAVPQVAAGDHSLRLLARDYPSVDAFLTDFKASGIAARGWVWTGYDAQTGLLFNYIGDAQNTFPVWGVKPVLALDVYEHAYYADFFTARAGYIDEFMNFVDWDVVNARL